MVKLGFTNQAKGLHFELPLVAVEVSDININNRNISPVIDSTLTVYESIPTHFYSELEHYTYEQVYQGTIRDTYICDTIPNLAITISYSIYPASVIGNTDNQGINMELEFNYPNRYTIKYAGTGYPMPTPHTTTMSASSFGPITVGYDTKNKCIWFIYSDKEIIRKNQTLMGKDYGDQSTISCDKYPVSKGSKKLESSSYYYRGEKINSYTTFNNTDIGGVITRGLLTINADARLKTDNAISELYNLIFITNDTPIPSYPGTSDPDNDSEPDAPIPGDGDTSSDAIPDPPPLPTWDINNTGFVTMYNPSVQQIRDLAYFMWSGDFTDLIKKMFAAPFDALISLKMLFVDVPAGTSQEIWLGNVETGVSAPKLAKQFIDVDMGSITINEFFGSFADYAPFTKIQIFLPFIGYKDLNVDEVMNSNLHLRYRIDAYSGACIAFLTVTKTIKSTNLNSILYQFDGNCAMELPFTQNDNSRYVAAILNSAASSALSLAATSTFTPPTVAQGYAKGESAKFELGSLAPVANGMMDVLSTKPNVQRAGSLAGAVAAMGVKQPYIIIHRPIAQMPSNYQHYLGIPLNLTRQLSTVKGYTIVSQVFITSETATDEEITMITQLLKSGVIL